MIFVNLVFPCRKNSVSTPLSNMGIPLRKFYMDTPFPDLPHKKRAFRPLGEAYILDNGRYRI